MNVVICGYGAAGKSTLEKEFVSRGYEKVVMYTTRPPREKGYIYADTTEGEKYAVYEENGIDYNFVSDDIFEKMNNDGEFITVEEYVQPGGDIWKYGVPKKDCTGKNKVMVIGSAALWHFIEYVNNEVEYSSENEGYSIVMLTADERIRIRRMILRGDSPKNIERRLENDKKYLTDYYLGENLPGYVCEYYGLSNARRNHCIEHINMDMDLVFDTSEPGLSTNVVADAIQMFNNNARSESWKAIKYNQMIREVFWPVKIQEYLDNDIWFERDA